MNAGSFRPPRYLNPAMNFLESTGICRLRTLLAYDRRRQKSRDCFELRRARKEAQAYFYAYSTNRTRAQGLTGKAESERTKEREKSRKREEKGETPRMFDCFTNTYYVLRSEFVADVSIRNVSVRK